MTQDADQSDRRNFRRNVIEKKNILSPETASVSILNEQIDRGDSLFPLSV